MNKKITDFYILANRLKNKVRTGWIEIGISKERLESVAEHIYGCLMLAVAIDSEYDLNLDMYKVLKMISLHELEETLMKDFSTRDNITREERIKLGKECVEKATEGLLKKNEIRNLLDEFNDHLTKESIFCYHIDKIECDFQAKVYDLEGFFSYEDAVTDLDYYGDRAKEIEEKSKTASDIWIEYDKPKYDDDELFKKLICDIQNLDTL